MGSKHRLWTREELILSFNLYLKIPFGQMHKTNPEVIQLAQLIDRTPSAVAMRLSNFASIDPYHQNRGVVGLKGGQAQCQPIWDEFHHNREELLYESERILAHKENSTVEQKFTDVLTDIDKYTGEEKLREVKTRVNQTIFRQIVLSTYSEKCAVSGINLPALLNASHIIPWSQNKKERLNPENGICLSKLYDAAFDRGLLTVKKDFTIFLSTEVLRQSHEDFFKYHFEPINGKKISLPDRYEPRQEFLEFHRDVIFKG